jgi:hypothetical protein
MRINHRIVWAAVFAVLVGGCSPAPPATGGGREKGAREAADAVAAGLLKLREYPPLPYPPGYQEYVRLLEERCGIQYEVSNLPPGVTQADFIQEVHAWNDVMKAELRRKFGADILDKLQDEASKRWKEQLDCAANR